MNRKKLISLSHREIVGFDDEYISINITKFKKYVYCLLASIGYILAGFYVGWSSKLLLLHEKSSEYNNLSRNQISWIVSAFPLGVVIVSMGLIKIYYCIGSKFLMMISSLIITMSWIFTIFFIGENFYILIASRVIGGIGSGIIFVILPIYMNEIGGLQYNNLIVDILITQFGLGIFIQYLLDTMPSLHLSIISIISSLVYFIICCLLPESPRYKYYCDISRKQCHDIEKDDVKLRNLWNEEDLQRKSITDLFVELRKLNLSSLIGLILVEQFIGGISILFYIKYFAQLTGGGGLSTELISKTVGFALISSIPIAKLTRFTAIRSTKKQIIVSSICIIVMMLALAILCITEGITGYKLNSNIRHLIPLPIFAVTTFFYVAGISRNLWLLVQQIFTSFSLQLHLRALSTATTWLVIFAITKVLPQLLYFVGVGYFYAYSVIFMIISLIYLQKIVPSTLNVEVDKALPIAQSLSASSCDDSIHAVTAHSSSDSSGDEIQEI